MEKKALVKLQHHHHQSQDAGTGAWGDASCQHGAILKQPLEEEQHPRTSIQPENLPRCYK